MTFVEENWNISVLTNIEKNVTAQTNNEKKCQSMDK